MSLFESGNLISQIEQQLTQLSERMKTFTGMGLNSDAKLLERFAADLLNRLYGWQLSDPASGDPTHKAFDLTDPARCLAIQVSVQEPSGKIKHTLGLITDEHRRTFTDIRCFFLLHHTFNKKPALPAITIRTLLDELKSKDPDTLRRFLSFLESELTTLPDDNPSLSDRLVSLLHKHRAHPALSKLRLRFSPAVIPAAEYWEGRTEELPRAAALLDKKQRLAVTGPGGIGKTALCARLVSQLSSPPAAIIVHDFYATPGLDSFIASVLHQASLRLDDPDLQPAAAARVLATPGILLYIEGAEKLTTLTPLLHFLSPGTRLLLTTRRRDHIGALTSLPLTPLSEPEAASLIHSHAAATGEASGLNPWPWPATSDGYALLARDLGCLPLACRLAGIHCGKMLDNGTALHAELTTHGLQSLLSGDDSRENLELLFSRTAARLASTSATTPAPALFAWQLLTLGGTHPTPLSVLQALGLPSLDALRILVDYGLAIASVVPAEKIGEQEPAYALTHALLATWARTGLAVHGCMDGNFVNACAEWGITAHAQMVHSGVVPGGESRYRIIAPLAENLLTIIKNQSGISLELLSYFFYFPARAHHLHASFLRAETLLRDALNYMEAVDGATPTVTAIALNNLAELLKETNRLAEAEPLLRRALAANERLQGPNHPNVASSLHNLAGLLQVTNRLTEAESLLIRAMTIWEHSYGQNHPQIAFGLNNLAQLYQDTNRLEEAEPLMRRALAIEKATFGEDHPQIAVRLNNLAGLLQATNRLSDGLLLMRRSLAIDEKFFGKNHPNVARALNNLGQFLQDMNNLAEAEPLMRRALEILESSYGKHHPNVAISLSNLAQLLQHTNRLAEAEPLMRRALAIDEASFHNEHPRVAACLNNLAQLLKATNRLMDAEPLMRRVMQIFVNFTANAEHQHPHLKAAINNYAGLLMEMGLTEADMLNEISKILEPVRHLLKRDGGK